MNVLKGLELVWAQEGGELIPNAHMGRTAFWPNLVARAQPLMRRWGLVPPRYLRDRSTGLYTRLRANQRAPLN